MANLSDAFGDIIVEKVGKEFIEYLKTVQGDDQAYYLLVDMDQLERAEVDEDGDLSLSFSTAGRWAYSNNIEGYLKGEWMHDDDKKEAYEKFSKALIAKNGVIDISYTDSDTAMDWMGTGNYRISVLDGALSISDSFEEERITLTGFAELQGEDAYWALGYIYGEEVCEVYDKYVDECKEKGVEPVEVDKWYDTIYESEE